ncbi:three-Cys-motif partner protein TcmP [Pontixanthobacter sp. CEM42]|uniref:three-Cys-motif partner protein TcmP n=1 Tax=Pontixanthobacter sp. CEM42 TaxID=2792077 RepID=UPI001ADF9F7E|nr:three-Cys-motif partner protein TcmP [Pontixanthobacter sp. CEM42]
MSNKIQSFGGAHTKKKLDAVAGYLEAYVTVMKKQSFWLSYVDGFVGSGSSMSQSSAALAEVQEPDLFPTNDVVRGSPVRALEVSPAFDEYVFIEADQSNVESLTALVSEFPDKNIQIQQGDANQRLIELAADLGADRRKRAVVFLDPFGLSVRWETMRALAATEKVDLWYLVPVHGMSRQIRNDGTFLSSATKIDELWGSTAWRELAVRPLETDADLFGDIDDRVEKVAKAKQFSEMFRDRLAEIFAGGVARNYLPLGRGRLHDFSLMFACANPSPAAHQTALRIANHILRPR